ncbi:hypothetical protein [Natrononativus amylolyticus]|uniref:hypothetical protein n=1 Tax=Natrononativus amylolyticus TaxID=2963434 RepID=UPI0020CFBF23|nr:hypothetical protein [Natrononativus amylolyticus]
MAQNPRTTEATSSSTTDRNKRLTRRSYVRSLAAVATATMATGATTAVTADDGTGSSESYDTIEVSAGEDRTITVESGETFENVLIDCTAEGARATVAAHGTDWTIRNVAIEGQFDVGAPGAAFGVSDTGGGSSTVENVYLADGSVKGGAATAETGIWVSPDHSGHIDFERINVQGFPDNGIYASAPGGAGGGTVHIDSCFAANCYVSHYRIGSAGSKVTNSSVLLDDDGYDGRGIWVWAPGTCEIEGCQLEMNGQHYAISAGANGNGTTAEVTETDYDTGFHSGIKERDGSNVELASDVGTDPEAFVPSGVPTTPEDAASGN